MNRETIIICWNIIANFAFFFLTWQKMKADLLAKVSGAMQELLDEQHEQNTADVKEVGTQI